MKKIILSLVMVITVFASAFAGDETVSKKAVKAFDKEFAAAKDVVWSVESNFYKVTFNYYDRNISAFYDKKGCLIGVTRYMLSTELPYYLQKELRGYYKDFWMVSLFELSKESGTSYHAILKNAQETIVISSDANNTWELFNHQKN